MTRLVPMIFCIATLIGCDRQSDEPVHEWLQRDNADIAAGNAALDAGDTEGALAAYDRAAASLPSQPGVHLDRGIALLSDGQYATARESLLRATDTPAGSDGLHSVEYFQNVKAAAYYNLGLSFYLEGDATAQGGATPETPGDPEAAQRLFRESITALTRSLQIKPGNRDAAWNLELARRRLREQEEEQERQEQENQEEEQEDQGAER